MSATHGARETKTTQKHHHTPPLFPTGQEKREMAEKRERKKSSEPSSFFPLSFFSFFSPFSPLFFSFFLFLLNRSFARSWAPFSPSFGDSSCLLHLRDLLFSAPTCRKRGSRKSSRGERLSSALFFGGTQIFFFCFVLLSLAFFRLYPLSPPRPHPPHF